MPLTPPTDASTQLQKTIHEIERRLAALEKAQGVIASDAQDGPGASDHSALVDRVSALEAPVPGPEWQEMVGDGPLHRRGYTPDPLPYAGLGTERVLHADGSWRRPLDGIVQAIPEGLNGIIAERRALVLGSLIVASGLSADTLYTRNLVVQGTASGIDTGSTYPPVLYSNFTATLKTTNNEDFYSFSIPANTLAVGDVLEFTSWIDAANTTGVNIYQFVRFAGTDQAFVAAGSGAQVRQMLRTLVLITASDAQRVWGENVHYLNTAGTGVAYLSDVTTPAGDITGAITASLRLAASGGTRDVTSRGLVVRRWTAA